MRRYLPYLAIALFVGPSAAAQEPPQPGVTVQDRGPVHEAFAQPADPSAPKSVAPTPPPAPINELPPAQKPEGENVQWVPGYWSWDDVGGRYLWVSGCWRVPPPGREWVAGSWVQVNGGWQWQPGFWSAPAGVQTFDSNPPESLEVGPSSPPPDAESYYVPGQWVYRDGNWLWQPGSWVQNPNGMVYVPPCYLPTPTGSLCNSGYWDYPLEDRGLLFAPVCFDGSPWVGNPGWCYRPSSAVTFGGLLGSLFARPGYGGYYFGNYFGAPYRGYGYVPWTGGSRRGYDPLLNYYTWANRGNPGWSRSLSGLYAGRLNGSFPAQAAGYDPAVISRNTVRFGRNVSVSPATSVNTVAPMSRLNGGHVRLTNVTRPEAFVRPNYPSRQTFSGEVARHTPGGQPHAPAVGPAAHLTAPAHPGAGVISAAPPHGGMPHAHPTAPAAPAVTPTHHSPAVTLRPPSGPHVGAGRLTAPPAATAPVVHQSPPAAHQGVALRPPQPHPAGPATGGLPHAPAAVPPAPAAHAHAAPTVHAPAALRSAPTPVVQPNPVHRAAPAAPHPAAASPHPVAARPAAVRPAPVARPSVPAAPPASVHRPAPAAPQRAAAPPRPAPSRPAPAAHAASVQHPTPHAAPPAAGHSAGKRR
jgi:hypothetical protein